MSRGPVPAVCIAATLTALALAGCIGGDPTPSGAAPAPPATFTVTYLVEDLPLPFLKVTLLGAGQPVAVGSTDMNGTVTLPVPPGADQAFLAYGNWSEEIPLRNPVNLIRASAVPAGESGVASDTDSAIGLTVARITDLGSWAYLYSANAATCRSLTVPPSATHDCGLSEPSVEVDAAGTLYYSAVCCVGGAPPIWVSRDDAATWELLGSTLGQREAFGIEGDFAVDDTGTMYFFDIELGAVQVSAWTADGTHLHTTHQPAPPLVDRPWVRAEGDGTVYIVYNQGIGSSTFLKSTDQGRTFLPAHTFPYGFANLARGTAPGELWATGPIEDGIVVDHSTDGGATWTRDAEIANPDGAWGFIVPVVDTNGTPYLVYDRLDPSDDGDPDSPPARRIVTTHRRADASWTPPTQVGPDTGTHIMPWIAAGGAGKLAIAWYGQLGQDSAPGGVHDDTPWHLMLATTLDGDTDAPNWQTIIADPAPVLVGPFTRQLLDFIQVDIGPDGAIHVAYAHQTPGNGNRETPVYLQTLANLPLVDGAILNGPKDA